MKKADVITAIQSHTTHPRKVIDEVLVAMGIVVSGELMANEPVIVPYLGQLLPVDVPQRQHKRVREAQFRPSRELRRKLDTPFRRARVSSR